MKLLVSLVLTALAVIATLPRRASVFLFNVMADITGTGRHQHFGLRYGVKVNEAISTQGYTLEVDTAVSGGPTWVEISQITDIPDPTGEASDLDATNLTSTSKEYIAGLRDSQSVNITGQRVKTDAGQNFLRDHAGDVEPHSFRATFPNGETQVFLATIKKFGVTGGVDAVLMFTSSIRGSGTVTWGEATT
jgi:hypothetical protein